jgi:hypothetical protein
MQAERRLACAGGFQTVAIVGFLSPLSVAVFGPACGRLLDLTPRRTALRFITSTQLGAIATAGVCASLRRVQE